MIVESSPKRSRPSELSAPTNALGIPAGTSVDSFTGTKKTNQPTENQNLSIGGLSKIGPTSTTYIATCVNSFISWFI